MLTPGFYWSEVQGWNVLLLFGWRHTKHPFQGVRTCTGCLLEKWENWSKALRKRLVVHVIIELKTILAFDFAKKRSGRKKESIFCYIVGYSFSWFQEPWYISSTCMAFCAFRGKFFTTKMLVLHFYLDSIKCWLEQKETMHCLVISGMCFFWIKICIGVAKTFWVILRQTILFM